MINQQIQEEEMADTTTTVAVTNTSPLQVKAPEIRLGQFIYSFLFLFPLLP